MGRGGNCQLHRCSLLARHAMDMGDAFWRHVSFVAVNHSHLSRQQVGCESRLKSSMSCFCFSQYRCGLTGGRRALLVPTEIKRLRSCQGNPHAGKSYDFLNFFCNPPESFFSFNSECDSYRLLRLLVLTMLRQLLDLVSWRASCSRLAVRLSFFISMMRKRL